MQEFKLNPNRYQEWYSLVLKRLLISGIVTLLILGSIFLFEFYDSSQDSIPVAIGAFVFFLILGYSGKKALMRQKDLYESYLLTITDDLLVREQKSLPDIDMAIQEVKSIEKTKHGHYIIRSVKKSRFIRISKYVENPEILEVALSNIKPIQAFKIQPNAFFPLVRMLIMYGTFMAVYAVENGYLSLLFTVLFATIAIWNLIEIRSNENVDKRTKRSSLFIIVLIVVAIIITIYKLFVQ